MNGATECASLPGAKWRGCFLRDRTRIFVGALQGSFMGLGDDRTPPNPDLPPDMIRTREAASSRLLSMMDMGRISDYGRGVDLRGRSSTSAQPFNHGSEEQVERLMFRTGDGHAPYMLGISTLVSYSYGSGPAPLIRKSWRPRRTGGAAPT